MKPTMLSDLYPFAVNPDLQAFTRSPIGTRVQDRAAFFAGVHAALSCHDTSTDWADGQHKVTLPLSLAERAGVTCGIGRNTRNLNQYILREYRGVVDHYLHRRNALKATRLECIVYTRDAFLNDPDVIAKGWAVDPKATHVIVAVLAWPDGVPERTPRSARRLVACLAGGNKEADAWTLETIREMSAETTAYEAEFCVIAGSGQE